MALRGSDAPESESFILVVITNLTRILNSLLVLQLTKHPQRRVDGRGGHFSDVVEPVERRVRPCGRQRPKKKERKNKKYMGCHILCLWFTVVIRLTFIPLMS